MNIVKKLNIIKKDEAEKQLLKEIELIASVQDTLARCIVVIVVINIVMNMHRHHHQHHRHKYCHHPLPHHHHRHKQCHEYACSATPTYLAGHKV